MHKNRDEVVANLTALASFPRLRRLTLLEPVEMEILEYIQSMAEMNGMHVVHSDVDIWWMPDYVQLDWVIEP